MYATMECTWIHVHFTVAYITGRPVERPVYSYQNYFGVRSENRLNRYLQSQNEAVQQHAQRRLSLADAAVPIVTLCFVFWRRVQIYLYTYLLTCLIARSFSAAGVLVVKEPAGLSRSDGKSPDGLSLVPWQNGKALCLNVTVIYTLADSYISAATRDAVTL